jgi:hypothetical protein
MPPANQPAEAGIINTAVACQLLMLSRQRIDQLVAAGHLQRHSPGHFRTVDVVQGYIRFLRDEDRRSSKSSADSRVRDARAHEIEVRTAERQGRLVSLEDYFAMIDGICGVTRSELSGLPARFTRDLALRKSLEREIYGALERIADAAAATAERLEAVRAADAAKPADDAGQVGVAEPDLSAVGGNTGAA